MTYLTQDKLVELIEHFGPLTEQGAYEWVRCNVVMALRELQELRERNGIRTPTHRCRECGALWIEYPPRAVNFIPEGAWSLFSTKCGQCCDNSADFLDKVEPLNVSDELRSVIKRLKAELTTEREAHAALQMRCFEGFPSASDGIFDAYRDLFKSFNELKDEDDDAAKLIQRQGDLLRGVVNAIKGEPPMSTSWSHHNAPELVRELVGDLALYKHGYAAARSEYEELRKAMSIPLKISSQGETDQ